ncbi:WD40 repeat domain-containing serine/threonine protein kinase [Parafrankia elaeagni]|uniref:WD40 repeat domain-containing serine/threonine protein kinase n=1 Tax=Parafrankia elaeagni TaxID=222534 RepID=UPI0003A2BAE3|nr:serine/threonine-protein kinase [Parafrankia elaeagni]
MFLDRARVAAALPGYDLGDEIGAGSFGLVLAGWHRGLQREVAIKVLAAGGPHRSFGSSEARITASLDHPHIVRVHDSAHTHDLDVIVMEMLAGGSLSHRQAGMGQEEFCAVGLAVAGALAYAHARGVLHRDIKPDNVMFDFAGQVKVVDFGIAKRVFGSAGTASAVIGTPLFMAPEQIARGRLGSATDLYALGMMLYLLLAGRSPFEGDLAEPVPGERPAPPSDRGLRRPAGVPPAVADVILRALATDPKSRPPSARAFAIDLAEAAADSYGTGWLGKSGIRVQLDDDVRAAAEGRFVPPTAVAAAPAAVADFPAAIESDDGSAPSRVGRRRATRLGQPTRSHRRSTRPRLHRRGVAAATALLLPLAAVLLIAAADQDAGGPASCHAGGPAPGQGTASTTPSQDTRDTTPSQDTASTASRQTGLLTGHTDWVTSVAFSPNKRILASGALDRTVRLWDVSDPSHAHQVGAPLRGHSCGVTAVAFSPDGLTVASVAKDGTVRLWDVTDPSHAHSLGAPLAGDAKSLHAVAFVSHAGRATDRQVMAVGGADGTVQLWDVTDREDPDPLGEPLPAHEDLVFSVALSSEGRTLATGSLDGSAKLWDVRDPARPLPHGALPEGHDGVYTLVFSRDARTLATGGKDALVRLWNVTNSARPQPWGRPLTGHTGIVWAVAISPNDHTLASAAGDGTVRLWDITDPADPDPLGPALTGHSHFVASLAFSPDGHTVASGSWDRSIRLWEVP